jgi:quinol monooxygenase YgiN
MSKVFLHVTISVRPGKYLEFVSLLKNHAATVRSEAGCEYLELFEGVESTDLVHVYETWSDRAAWDAHMANSASQAWRSTAEEFVLGESITLLKKL